MEHIENIIKQIEEIQEKIDNWEVDVDDFEDSYRDMLNECYDKFMGSYEPAYTLLQVDPTAYRCGLLDYVDSLEVTYPDGWDELLDDLLDDLLSTIDDELEILECEISGLQDEDGNDMEDAEDELDYYRGQVEYLTNLRKDWE